EAADYLYKINQYKKIDSIKITYTNKTPTKNSNNYSFNKTESELINNQSFGTFLDVWQTLQTDYLYNDKINDKDLIFGAIEGMVNQVDDNYTVFEKPGENIILDSLSSEYEGIGAILELIDEKVTIVSPLKNSPAEKAGLKPADIIIKIDGKDVTKQGVSEIIKQIKGPAGTSVKITITREGSPLNFTIKREKLFYETVSYKFLTKGTKKIAYLELKSFNEKTFEEFLKAAEDIVSQDADGLILDLRNNPGGYLGVAINIIGLFSDTSKTAIKMEFADNSIEPYDAPANGLLKDLQTVILINKGSASSSEVLAGALQDYKIAKLIGEKSFGKGVVQDIVEYKDDSLLKYTSAKWLTPNGRDINKKGLTPDRFILKTTTPNTDNQLTAALEEF
ncbi:MAG: S41 family peptidase, partial [Candidatus Gracilibacteria bacterium]